MTPQEMIRAAKRLSLNDLVYLVSQLAQLIESQVTQAPVEKKLPKEPRKPITSFRELSGLLYRADQPSVSIEEMNAAIEAEAGNLL